MTVLGALDISLVIMLLLIPSSDPATDPIVLALTPLPNSATPVTSILQKLTTLTETHPHSSQATPFTAFLKIAPLIHTQPLHYSPPYRPISQHFLFRCAHTLTSTQLHLFTNSVRPNTVMVILNTHQSLDIQCPCINDVISSYTNRGCLHGNGPISWSLQNLFTYPTLGSLFNIIHPSNTPIMKTLQDFNSDPTSYISTTHNINAFFDKTDDVSVLSWLQEITSIILSVILHNILFHHSNLWIPLTHLSTSLKYFYLYIISHYLPTSWTFYIQVSHATDFG